MILYNNTIWILLYYHGISWYIIIEHTRREPWDRWGPVTPKTDRLWVAGTGSSTSSASMALPLLQKRTGFHGGYTQFTYNLQLTSQFFLWFFFPDVWVDGHVDKWISGHIYSSTASKPAYDWADWHLVWLERSILVPVWAIPKLLNMMWQRFNLD